MFGAGLERFVVDTTANSPIQYQNFVRDFGNTNNTLRMDASFARDSRDNFLFPTKGSLQRASVEFGAPPGDLQYYKLSMQHQQYFPLGKDFTLMLNGEIGYGGGLGGKPLPFFRNFFAGGVTSVRGFETGTIGPKTPAAKSTSVPCNTVSLADCDIVALGGDTKLLGNVELLFPMPGIKDNSVRLSTFLDAGGVFGIGDNRFGSNQFSLDELRYSVGLGLAWNSPLGPLKFSLAYPLNKDEWDKTQVFQFNMGSSF